MIFAIGFICGAAFAGVTLFVWAMCAAGANADREWARMHHGKRV